MWFGHYLLKAIILNKCAVQCKKISQPRLYLYDLLYNDTDVVVPINLVNAIE